MENPTQIREVVRFKLAAGIGRTEFQDAVRDTTPAIRALPGFVARELFHDSEQDTWLDVVTWTSRGHAAQAQLAFPTLPGAEALMRAIDMETIDMLHVEPVTISAVESE